MRLTRLNFLSLTCAAALAACAPAPAIPIVAAASDLSIVLPEIAQQFERERGDRVELVFGSSGVLARQIRDGAPFELYMSADEAFVSQLATEGRTRDGGVLYALGRIVLFAPTGSPLVPGQGLAALAGAISATPQSRFAIANPSHAPYGRAAEAALRGEGVWDAVSPRLVLGENVSQAAQFASSGMTLGGIISLSMAQAPLLAGRGTFALIPETDHPPIRQRMALLTRSGDVAGRFYQYLQGPEARAIFTRHGFGLPE